jgi:hypothetical protein
VGISLNELTGLKYNCTPAQFVELNASLVCPITSGEMVSGAISLYICSLLILFVLVFALSFNLTCRLLTSWDSITSLLAAASDAC